MNLTQLLSIGGRIEPKDFKIHLACFNGNEDPMDVYLAGGFKRWQEEQNNQNFQRRFILSLIKTPGRDRWLFGGVFQSKGCAWNSERKLYLYETEPVSAFEEFDGRLVVQFQRRGRQSYLLAENWIDKISVIEFREKRVAVPDFPGFKKLHISHSDLRTIVAEGIPSWRSALGSVSGVYLISDSETGQQYVGSASGVLGIWQRWSEYATTGHGGNREIQDVLKNRGFDHLRFFRYSILETCDSSASNEEVVERECHWKRVLQTIRFGYNRN